MVITYIKILFRGLGKVVQNSYVYHTKVSEHTCIYARICALKLSFSEGSAEDFPFLCRLIDWSKDHESASRGARRALKYYYLSLEV